MRPVYAETHRLRLQVSKPLLVAQTGDTSVRWGIWQFPAITSLALGRLDVSFSQTVDDATLDSAARINPLGVCVSTDQGQTWQTADADHPITRWRINPSGICARRNGDVICLQSPPARDIAKTELPAPAGTCDNGYHGVYTVRDPLRMPAGMMEYLLMRRVKGGQGFECVGTRMNDPDAGIMCFDPPRAAHAVVYWWGGCEQIVELPDTSLLAVFYGYRLGPDCKPYPKYVCWCLRSVDDGLTWDFHAIIARDDKSPWAGFTEPRLTVLRDGSLLAVLRTECFKTGPLFRSRSTDSGKTWSTPEQIWPFGVLPQLLTLDNGMTVLAFGRPGTHVLFSADGAGTQWGDAVHVVTESFEGTGIQGEGYGFQRGEAPVDRPKQTRTSGYTGLLATGPDSFLLAYDQFDYPNADGQPRKSILLRRFTVTPE